MVGCDYSSKIMIYYAKNIKVTEKNIKLFSNDDITKLNMLKNNNICCEGSLLDFVMIVKL